MASQPKPDPLLEPDEAIDHIRGRSSAPVTVVEYGDFECPSCFQAYGALKVILPHFGQQLRFVYRHFPLREVHPHAELAAEAAEAAGAQGKFWPMHELLFTHQQHLKDKQLLEYAAQVGLEARHPEWLDVGRGLNREEVDNEGRRVSHLTDETTNRAFWKHYRTVMSA